MADIQARDLPVSEPDTTPAADRDTSERTEADRRDADGSDKDRRSHRFVGSTPFLILVALAVALLVKTFLIQAFYIPSESMEPTLEIGDRVFVNKLAYDIGDLGRGDVIVFSNPHPEQLPERGAVNAFLHWLGEGIGFAQPADEDFIKRVVGLPGETIEILDNVVYIDGEPLDEPYLTDAARQSNGDFPETRIPAGHLFMMGDNRGNSADSRYGLGLVPVDKVIGRAFIVIWPPSQFGGV
jgi:signal peptidase I